MKTIKQNVLAHFNTIELKDAVALTGLMDQLAKSIRENKILDFVASPLVAKNIYNILSELGFCTLDEQEITSEEMEETKPFVPEQDTYEEKSSLPINGYERYILIRWPQIQKLMNLDAFQDNAILDTRIDATDSTYAVSEDWLNQFPDEILAEIFG